MATVQAGTTESQRKAIDTIATYQGQVSAIRADTSLSQEGRRVSLARVYISYRDAVAQIQAGEQAANATRSDTLERDLFGLNGLTDASTAISYRDAQDRAASIEDSRDALRLLKQADLSGDVHLAKAVALRALQEGWVDAISTYAASHPDVEGKLQELLSLHPTGDQGIAQGFGAAMSYYVEVPTELAALSESSIAGLANGPQVGA